MIPFLIPCTIMEKIKFWLDDSFFFFSLSDYFVKIIPDLFRF